MFSADECFGELQSSMISFEESTFYFQSCAYLWCIKVTLIAMTLNATLLTIPASIRVLRG